MFMCHNKRKSQPIKLSDEDKKKILVMVEQEIEKKKNRNSDVTGPQTTSEASD